MRSLSPLVLAIALGMTPAAAAQQPPAQSPLPPTQAIDPTKLGIDLNRVKKGVNEMKLTPEEQQLADGVRLNLHVQVFGEAPTPDFFENFDPVVGPVPFGGPTHKEVLDVLTPQEFRAPAANFFGLAMWLAGKISSNSERQRCEQELERYKTQVLAGVPVAAPTCAR